MLCTLMGKRKETKSRCIGCRQYFHVNCFTALHKDRKLKTFAQLSTTLAANTKVKEFVTGKSYYNIKDQVDIGTVEDMIMPYDN